MDWLLPPAGCRVAVDLAAGTGLFTRALLGRVPEVIAVEPDERMREVLARRSPDVRVLAGRGEAIPLPDASADAVFVSTAWHWFDPVRAVPEIARVLRPGGRLGVIWTSRDREEDWVAELDLLRLRGIDPDDGDQNDGDQNDGEPHTLDAVRARLDAHHTVTLPEGAEFGDVRLASFAFSRVVSIDDAVDWLATNSSVITAAEANRLAGLDRWRQALLTRSDGAPEIEMPMRSWCWRADRR